MNKSLLQFIIFLCILAVALNVTVIIIVTRLINQNNFSVISVNQNNEFFDADTVVDIEQIANEEEESQGIKSKLISIDEIWDRYTDYELGFSAQVPKSTKRQSVTIKKFGDIVWIAAIDNLGYYNEKLQKLENENLSDYEKARGTPWAILVKKVNNEDELKTFIKNRYHQECELGEIKEISGTGMYDVSIDRGNLNLQDGTGCFINYITVIKYSPEKNLVAAWDIGQSINFLLDEVPEADFEMANSFMFQ